MWVSHSVGWLADWSVGRSASQSVGRFYGFRYVKLTFDLSDVIGMPIFIIPAGLFTKKISCYFNISRFSVNLLKDAF